MGEADQLACHLDVYDVPAFDDLLRMCMISIRQELETKRDAEIERLRTELAALKAEIEAAPLVYLYGGNPVGGVCDVRAGWHTHRARLIRIEGLK